jgi:S1-C subfamily serine protease
MIGGLKAGDKLVAVNDRSIDAPRDIARALAKILPGTRVTFKLKRGDETLSLVVKLDKGI